MGGAATLIAMEVVLGLDNLVFIALLTNRIDERRRGLARKLGLSLALVFRLALLASALWVVHLTEPLATVLGHAFSVRDLLLWPAACSWSGRRRAKSTTASTRMTRTMTKSRLRRSASSPASSRSS